MGLTLRPFALASVLFAVTAAAGPSLEGSYGGRDLGVLQLSTSIGGEVTGKAKKGGACNFKPDTPVLSAAWQGNVLVGHLTLCLTGSGCPSEKRVPFLAVWQAGTLAGDVKLLPGCRSPALPDQRLELSPSNGDDRGSKGPGPSAESVAKRAMTEKEREAYLKSQLQQGVDELNRRDYKQARHTFETAMESGADNSVVYMGLGVAMVRMGDSAKGIETLTRATQLAKAERNNAVLGQTLFNLACAHATLGKEQDALANLRQAAKFMGPKDLETALDEERDLDALKDNPEYRSFAASVHLDAAKASKKRGGP